MKNKRLLSAAMAIAMSFSAVPTAFLSQPVIPLTAIAAEAESTYIIDQPQNCYINSSGNVTFGITTSTDNCSYQWEYRKGSTGNWIRVTNNGTSKTYTTSGSSTRNGWEFRCKVMDAAGSVIETSDTAKIIYGSEIFKISTNPSDAVIREAGNVSFRVSANTDQVTNDPCTYQWEYSKDGGKNWIRVTKNGTSASYTTTGSATRNGWLFRCNVTYGNMTLKSKSAAIVFKNNDFEINGQPEDQIITENKNVTFAVSTNASAPSYQWEYSKDGGNSWIKVTKNGTSASYTTTGYASRNGWLFRCNVTSGGTTKTSNAAAIIFEEQNQINILQQPEDVTISENGNVLFACEAEGKDLEYQWEYSKDKGRSWIKVTKNGTSNFYKTAGTESRNGWLFRCQITSGTNTVTTADAKIIFKEKEIVPTDINLNVGDTYQLDVTGTGYSYFSTEKYCVSVSNKGVVKAEKEGSSQIMVISPSGKKAIYRIYVSEDHEELAFESTTLSLDSDEKGYLFTNSSASYLSSDPNKLYVDYDYYRSDICYVHGIIPGSYNVVAYNNCGEMAIANVTIEGNVTDAVADTYYSGDVDIFTDIWYKYVNNSDVCQLITFDVATEAEDTDMVPARFNIYRAPNYGNSEYKGVDLENAQEFINPGEEVFVRVQSTESLEGKYGFTFNVTDYTTTQFNLGVQQQNIQLDRKDFTGYTFTTPATGSYKLVAQSRTPFYWEIQDNANGNEMITSGSCTSSCIDTFELEGNKDYTIRFVPNDKTKTGTLKFTLSKEDDNIADAYVNEEYEDVITGGQSQYYKYVLEGGQNDVFELDFKNDYYIHYDLLREDMSTPYATYNSTNGWKIYKNDDKPLTLYLKVSVDSGYDCGTALFNLRQYDLNYNVVDEVYESSTSITQNEVQWYEFTAPETGRYAIYFEHTNSSDSAPLDFEGYHVNDGVKTFDSQLSSYYSEGWDNSLDLSAVFNEGETIAIKITGRFNNDDESVDSEVLFKINLSEAFDVGDIELDTPVHVENRDGNVKWFRFEVPESGMYYFWSESDYDMYGALYNNLDSDYITDGGYGGYNYNFCISTLLRKGQTVYLKANEYNYADCDFDLVVSKTNRSYEYSAKE
ncbi:MAG: hypothetical protein KBA55_04035 [Ruminococcus sp.]|nr:hypothetical protein [Ruminococcus sp.]